LQVRIVCGYRHEVAMIRFHFGSEASCLTTWSPVMQLAPGTKATNSLSDSIAAALIPIHA
jgi:hypothetical protein